MTISICIPTFNRLPYLKELMGRLLPQVASFGTDRLELLVSDNCSTDGTSKYLASLKTSNLRYWTNEKNIGADRNFLVCIQEARGEYIWLVGDDDIIRPNAVDSILSVLEKDRPDLLIADEFDYGRKVYTDYRSCLIGESKRNRLLALSHTLISANIFKKTLFDNAYAEGKLWTQYSHMFGFIGNIQGKVILLPKIMCTREVRADFAKYPSFLCVKHGIYLWWLAKKFDLPGYRWRAILSVCNLPMEFGSRIKYYLNKIFRLCFK